MSKTDTELQVLKSLLEDEGLDLHALYESLSAKSKITVKNNFHQTLWVKISKACGEGQDGFWKIDPEGSETWKRCVYHRVTMKTSRTGDDAGIYDSVDHTVMTTTNCNNWVINEGGVLQYVGPPECL